MHILPTYDHVLVNSTDLLSLAFIAYGTNIIKSFPVFQGQYLFQRLLNLKSRGVKLKIVSDQPNSIEIKSMSDRCK